jgi:hypothetical protein
VKKYVFSGAWGPLILFAAAFAGSSEKLNLPPQ